MNLKNATIVLVKGTESTDELKKEIQEYVKTRTAPYKYPKIVEFVDELPKTISGKVRRVEIRKNNIKNEQVIFLSRRKITFLRLN